MAVRENIATSTLLRVIPEDLAPRIQGSVVRVAHDGDPFIFRPVWVGEGFPADVRRGRNEIVHHTDAELGVIPVVVARKISPGAREYLEDEGLSWADAQGKAKLMVPGRLYVTRLAPSRTNVEREFAWSAAASAIAEMLLSWRMNFPEGDVPPMDRVAEIAEMTDISLAHTARVLRQFDERGYTTKFGPERGSAARREFRDAGRMLSDWAGNYGSGSGPGKAIEFHVPWREADQSMFVMINALGKEWAATGAVAAEKIAPYLTNVSTLDAYVPTGHLDAARIRLSSDTSVTQVQSGGRIRLYEADSYVFRMANEVKGVPTVSPIRVYADLLRQGGRAGEAAEFLREVAIGL